MHDRIEHLQIACYKWGTRYTSNEVNILKGMVARNLAIPHRFHCLTDDASGLDPDIVAHDLPPAKAKGFYRKLFSFSRDFLGRPGEHVVVMDIDLVIVSNIDFLAERASADFIVAEDFSFPGKTHTAVYRLRIGSMPKVWENYIEDVEGADRIEPDRDDRDQLWTERMVDRIEYFPPGKIVSFKYHCKSQAGRMLGKTGARMGLTTSHFGVAECPPDAAIVSFHGEPLPRDVRTGRFLHYRQAPFVETHWRA